MFRESTNIGMMVTALVLVVSPYSSSSTAPVVMRVLENPARLSALAISALPIGREPG